VHRRYDTFELPEAPESPGGLLPDQLALSFSTDHEGNIASVAVPFEPLVRHIAARHRVPVIARCRSVRQVDLALEEVVPPQQPFWDHMLVVEGDGAGLSAADETAIAKADVTDEPLQLPCRPHRLPCRQLAASRCSSLVCGNNRTLT
jgi:hypothetical protein